MIYDCIIIGAGPAGLSSSIYLGRAHKKTLLIYSTPMRTSLAININNYLGFDNISGNELIDIGLKQAEKYGVEILISTVKNIIKEDIFSVITYQGTFSSKYVIVASGINDVLPNIDNLFEFLGETFFTCFDCDGYRMTNKNVFIIGNEDSSARTALAIKQTYTNKITICTGKENKISIKYIKKLQEENINIINKNIKHINGDNGTIENIVLDDNSILKCDCILSDLGYERNDSFLQGLNLKRSETGYIKVNSHYESSIKNLFVIGPLNTGPDQVSVAVGQGAIAAIHIIESEFKLEV